MRNLSKEVVDDGQLKQLCLKALKAGVEKGLVTSKDIEMQLIASGVKPVLRTPERLLYPPITNKAISKAKVMKDLNKLRNGLAQPKGNSLTHSLTHSLTYSLTHEKVMGLLILLNMHMH